MNAELRERLVSIARGELNQNHPVTRVEGVTCVPGHTSKPLKLHGYTGYPSRTASSVSSVKERVTERVTGPIEHDEAERTAIAIEPGRVSLEELPEQLAIDILLAELARRTSAAAPASQSNVAPAVMPVATDIADGAVRHAVDCIGTALESLANKGEDTLAGIQQYLNAFAVAACTHFDDDQLIGILEKGRSMRRARNAKLAIEQWLLSRAATTVISL